jgi:hypothetical protein
MIGSAWAEDAVQPEPQAAAGQARLAETTQKLESAFSEQFVAGRIDRAALAPLVSEVVQSMPEAAKPKAQSHIDQVIQHGETLASQMAPDERALIAAAPAVENIGTTQAAQVAAWGWPGYAGFGGLGAFGFPGNCIPYGTGYAVPYGGIGWNGFESGYSSAYSCTTGFGFGW